MYRAFNGRPNGASRSFIVFPWQIQRDFLSREFKIVVPHKENGPNASYQSSYTTQNGTNEQICFHIHEQKLAILLNSRRLTLLVQDYFLHLKQNLQRILPQRKASVLKMNQTAILPWVGQNIGFISPKHKYWHSVHTPIVFDASRTFLYMKNNHNAVIMASHCFGKASKQFCCKVCVKDLGHIQNDVRRSHFILAWISNCENEKHLLLAHQTPTVWD